MELVAEVDMLNIGVFLDAFHRAFGEEFPEVEDGDLVGDALYEFHVVFDDDEGAVFGDFAEEDSRGVAFGGAHAGDGLVEHEEFWLLHEEHADFEPLFLAVAKYRGGGLEVVLEVDSGCDGVDAFADLGGLSKGDAPEDAAPGGIGNLQVFENAEVFINGGGLKLAADPGANDAVFLHAEDVAVFKADAARGRAGFAADEVEEGGFASAIRSDHHTKFVVVDVEAKFVDGFKSVEGDGEIFDSEKVIGV